jgi:hypothetical protein
LVRGEGVRTECIQNDSFRLSFNLSNESLNTGDDRIEDVLSVDTSV